MFVIAISFLLSCPIIAAESFHFSGKIKCELSATFIVLTLITKLPYATTLIPPGTDYQTMKQKGVNSKKLFIPFPGMT